MKMLSVFLLNLIFLHNGFCLKSTNLGEFIRELSIGVTADCGISNNVDTRIKNGEVTESHEFPWMVSIQNKFTLDFYIHICGGSVIHPSWVITAAYCVDDMEIEKTRIVVGSDKLVEPEDPDQIRYVQEYFLNDYDSHFYTNDIALFRLDKDLELNGVTVAPICLPDADEKFNSFYVIVAGWGFTKIGKAQLVGQPLKKTTLAIYPFDECEAQYEDYGYKGYLNGNNFCTVGGEYEPCTNDNGGPVMTNDGKKYFLLGIIGVYNCAASLPGVQTNVSCFADWIKETIDDN